MQKRPPEAPAAAGESTGNYAASRGVATGGGREVVWEVAEAQERL